MACGCDLYVKVLTSFAMMCGMTYCEIIYYCHFAKVFYRHFENIAPFLHKSIMKTRLLLDLEMYV